MPAFAGVNHSALSVTDLERSTRFYAEVLGLVPVLDFGHGCVLLDRATGFSVGLIRHADGDGASFTEVHAGLDHLGLAAPDRDDLVAWERRFLQLGVPHSPIQDTEFGSHLNFRDPDGIPLELQAPNEIYATLVGHLRDADVPDAVLRDHAEQLLGSGMVIRPTE